MDERLTNLGEAGAQQILENYVAWIADRHGLVMLLTFDKLRAAGALNHPWVNGDGSFPGRAQALRVAINELLLHGDTDTRSWMSSSIDDYLTTGRAESVVAAVLGGMAILGITSVALVLAARVKKIGTAEFYEGVPEEVVRIVEQVKTDVPTLPTLEK